MESVEGREKVNVYLMSTEPTHFTLPSLALSRILLPGLELNFALRNALRMSSSRISVVSAGTDLGLAPVPELPYIALSSLHHRNGVS